MGFFRKKETKKDRLKAFAKDVIIKTERDKADKAKRKMAVRAELKKIKAQATQPRGEKFKKFVSAVGKGSANFAKSGGFKQLSSNPNLASNVLNLDSPRKKKQKNPLDELRLF